MIGAQRRSVHVRGIGQQLRLGDQPRPAVLGDRRQRHRRGHRRVVHRRDVEAGAGRHRRRDAVGHRVAERHRGVVVGRRGVAPGAVAVVDQRAAAGGDRQVDRRQRRSVDVRGIGQQLRLRDQPRAAVLGDRRQRHRRRHRRVVHRRDVERCAGGHRRRDAVGHRVAERHRGVVVGRRGVAPGAVAVVDQRAAAGGDRQVDGAERRSVHVRRIGQAAPPA